MQKRSLTKIFLYSVLSLGIYELVWLYQTRRELAKLTNIWIPSVKWLVLLNVLQLAGLALGIVLIVLIFGANKATPVSSTCWAEYALSAAPQPSDRVSLSNDCRSQINRSNAAINRQDKLIKGYLLVIFLLLVSRLGYPRWLRNYALAVQHVTGGRLSQAQTMFMLVFATPYGMMAVQNVFNGNNTMLMPGFAPYQSSENKSVHKALSVVATSMAILFGLLILGLVVLSYYGTH